MTVEELMTILSDMDPDMEVYKRENHDYYGPLNIKIDGTDLVSIDEEICLILL